MGACPGTPRRAGASRVAEAGAVAAGRLTASISSVGPRAPPSAPRSTRGGTLMDRPLLVVAGALAWLGLAGAGARAEMIPWGYSWTPNVAAVSADVPGAGKIVL